MRRFAAILLVLATPALFAERQPLDHYRSIVDRQMFGPLPEGFDPTKPPSEVNAREEKAKDEARAKEEAKIKSAIRFSAINLTPEGATAVGFTDSSDPKNPMDYYLKVGESRNGWTVKQADALKATMTIAKGNIEVDLTLGGDSSKGGARLVDPSASAASSPSSSGTRSSLLAGSGGLASMRERRARRAAEEAERRAAEETARAQREQAAAAEKAERELREQEQAKEREQQRQQLEAIQEELRRAREERAAREAEKPAEPKPPEEGK